LWVLSSVVCISVGVLIGNFHNGGITYSGEDIKPWFLLVFVIIGLLFILISIGTYFQKKVTLLLVVPYTMFSAFYFVDQVFTEYVWAKYVYQSTFMVVLNILTLHVLIFNRQALSTNA
jgi:hypothetical protein